MRANQISRYVSLAAIVLSAAMGQARADFSEYYSFPRQPGQTAFAFEADASGPYTTRANNWSIYSNHDITFSGPGGGSNLWASDSQLYLNSGVPSWYPLVTSLGTLEVSTVAPRDGFLSFDFTLSLSAASQVTAREGYFFIDGNKFTLPGGSGTISGIPLKAGDTFGFGVSVTRYQFGFVSAQLSVTNFAAPVPEPSSITLLIVGALLSVLIAYSPKHLTRRCSERRAVLMCKSYSVRRSFLTRAVADLESR